MKELQGEDAPLLVAVGGQIASGKTTVSTGLAEALGAALLGADDLRRALYESGRAEAYAPGFSRELYPEILRRAAELLGEGRSVVLDGSFRSKELRAAVRRIAEDRRARFRFVECAVPEEMCRERLRQRERDRGETGWQEMFDHFLRDWEPVDELPPHQHHVFDATLPPEGRIEALAERLRRGETASGKAPEREAKSDRSKEEAETEDRLPLYARHVDRAARTPAEAVTFDCWGTLIFERETDLGYARRVEALLVTARDRGANVSASDARAALDAAWERHHDLWIAGIASGPREIADWALARLGVVDSDASVSLAHAFAEAALASEIVALEGARATLERLADRGIRRALVCDTGFTPGAQVRELLDRAGLLELLEVQIFSDEAGVPKPHPRVFRAALDALQTHPFSAVHVGDLRHTDIRGARGLGMGTVRIRSHYDDRSDEHPEADAIADSHGHLLEILGLD